MTFTDIRLQNFRSYVDASFELASGVTIVVGPNGAGKTNLLEALMLVAADKTYRSNTSLIQHQKPWARIDVHSDSNSTRVIKLQSQTNKTVQSIEIDNKPYIRLPASQRYTVVLFEPNHLFLLHGQPELRRSYLDDLLEQLDLGFAKHRIDFRRALYQRNALLKQRFFDKDLIFAWDVRLSDSASIIFNKRNELIKDLNKQAAKIYSDIADDKTKVEIVYESVLTAENYTANLLKKLTQNLEADLARGHTSSGPHRDDILFKINGQLAGSTSSRGEIRTLILCLKILELKLLEEKLGQKPLLLLDDVFSELDGSRRRALVNYLKEHQTIITTTDADIVTKNFSQKCQIIPLG